MVFFLKIKIKIIRAINEADRSAKKMLILSDKGKKKINTINSLSILTVL